MPLSGCNETARCARLASPGPLPPGTATCSLTHCSPLLPSELCLPLGVTPGTDGHWRAFDGYSNPWTTLSTLPLMQTPHKTWSGKLIHVNDFLERWLQEDELNMNTKVCPESVGLATLPFILIFFLPWHRKQE